MINIKGKTIYGPNVVTSGLVLYLDAANTRSYPGTGTTWFDLSGGSRNYTFGSGITWNSAGYFNCSGTGGVFTGPASNSFGFASTNEHTIEVFAQVNAESTNFFFNWRATPNTGTDERAIFAHLYYSGGSTFYDVSGCCSATQRIAYTSDPDLLTGVRHLVWRTRTNTTPNRQFFKNTISQMDSGANSTATVNWNLTTAATIADNWNGKLYLFKAYNRALTDAEISQNFNAYKKKYGLS